MAVVGANTFVPTTTINYARLKTTHSTPRKSDVGEKC
jgi:hypothetical protein